MPLDFLLFLLLVGGIGPWVRHIMAVDAPMDYPLASGGACFVCWGQRDFLGIVQGFFIYLDSGVFCGVVEVYSGVISPGVHPILAVSDPVLRDIVSGGVCSSFWWWGEVWVLSVRLSLYGIGFSREGSWYLPEELVQGSPVFC